MQDSNQIKILFLAAAPSDEPPLCIDKELRDIREALQQAQERRFVLEYRGALRPRDISQAILHVKPQIVHFSGHGKNTGELCFENNSGKAQPVSANALAELFKEVGEEIKCVLLNACHAEAQAKAIAEHIPFVIGMNQTIIDKAAIAFSVGFYKALAAGRTIEKAYNLGCVEIQLEDIPEHLKPVLYKKKYFCPRFAACNSAGTS
ncbi:MAG: CHAT domain-containing protein [Heteroscytonema crispum UTEX LB 1556]